MTAWVNFLVSGSVPNNLERLLIVRGVLQVVRLPVDFVFFRVRPDGSIPDTDVMLPGYAFAKRELKARQKAIAAHEVLLPQKNVKLTPRIWKKWKAPPQGAIKHKKQTVTCVSTALHAWCSCSCDATIHGT